MSNVTSLFLASLPSCGTITAFAPVSKFPGEPSALSNFVDIWDVVIICDWNEATDHGQVLFALTVRLFNALACKNT
jgi:hypothetical protein